MSYDWKPLAGRLAEIGLPILAKIIGGEIRRIPIVGSLVSPEMIESGMRVAMSKVLGVEATPEAIGAAIESGSTSDVVTSLRGLEAEAASRWPALAEIAGVEADVEKSAITSNAETFRQIQAAEMAKNDFWPSFYRTLLMWGAMGGLMLFNAVLFYGLLLDASLYARVNDARDLWIWWMGGLASILGVHFVARGVERSAAIKPPTVIAQPPKAIAAKR